MPARPYLKSKLHLCLLLLLLLPACRRPAPPQAPHVAPAPPVQAAPAPSPIEPRIAALPAVLARIDGTAVPREAIAPELRALADGGVLSPNADDVTWQRTVATRLEARIDALLVSRALGRQQEQDAYRLAQADLAQLQARHGDKTTWLQHLKLRGENEAMRLETLAMRRGLALLTRDDPAVAVPDTELRERFELQNKALAETGRPPLTFETARGALEANLKRMREFAAARNLLARLRAAARIERTPPFDHPPGGLPLAGTVTASLPEPDDD